MGNNHKASLSKSRLLSAAQCQKRAWLETHQPDLVTPSPQTESLFKTGREAGEIARHIYGGLTATPIPFDYTTMFEATRRRIDRGDAPIFEATFRHDNLLIRADILLPVDDDWRAVEVKASTKVKPEHTLDCAIQLHVMRGWGLPVRSIALAHVDNSFVYAGDGDYRGMLVEQDLTEGATALLLQVEALVDTTRATLAGPVPDVPVGDHCTTPYPCPFIDHCWPTDTRYPIAGLGGGRAKLGEHVAQGCSDIRDVDPAVVSNPTQQRILRVTRSGEAELLPQAGETLRALDYPRYYLDFETIGPAVPIWPGTRPYEPVPVQWSCHVETEPGAIHHKEFLDLSGAPPMRALAERLIACLGDAGPVLTYTTYEAQVIRGLVARFPDLAQPLGTIVDRLFDLHPVVKANYYHPDMLGSWSIKAVLPTIAPEMDYAALEGINQGTAASEGFLEAIAAGTLADRKAELEGQLRRYCRFDTEAMVEIVTFFSRL